jgi:hypothetical protein
LLPIAITAIGAYIYKSRTNIIEKIGLRKKAYMKRIQASYDIAYHNKGGWFLYNP